MRDGGWVWGAIERRVFLEAVVLLGFWAWFGKALVLGWGRTGSRRIGRSVVGALSYCCMSHSLE